MILMIIAFYFKIFKMLSVAYCPFLLDAPRILRADRLGQPSVRLSAFIFFSF
jgi:hypothetical protein